MISPTKTKNKTLVQVVVDTERGIGDDIRVAGWCEKKGSWLVSSKIVKKCMVAFGYGFRCSILTAVQILLLLVLLLLLLDGPDGRTGGRTERTDGRADGTDGRTHGRASEN